MATFNIEYICTNCEKTDKASNTDTNDSTTESVFAAKAVDGCYFVENDGNNCYMETMGTNGILRTFKINLQKVSSEYDSQVINGTKAGITSDGKYICGIYTAGNANTGTRKCYFKASGGTPEKPTNLLRYNTTGLTEIGRASCRERV